MTNGWGDKDADGPDASRLMKELREVAGAVRMAALVLESGEAAAREQERRWTGASGST